MTNAYNPGSGFRRGSGYSERPDPMARAKDEFHAGQDFVAKAGTPIPAAASGTVVYSGFNDGLGNVVIVKNDTGGYSLYGHMLDGDRAAPGQRIWQGDTLGLVGSTGLRSTNPHLHYSVIRQKVGDEQYAGKHLRNGGPIGVHLNKDTTVDPAGYDDYDPTPRYPDQTGRAAEMLSATVAGGIPGDRRSGPRTSGAAAPVLPGRSRPFDNRFGNWDSALAGVGQTETQGLAGIHPGQYPSPRMGGQAPGSVPGTGASADRRDSFNDRFGNWISSQDSGIPLDPNLPVPPPEPGRPLGIFSGQPMPAWATPLPFEWLFNKSSR